MTPDERMGHRTEIDRLKAVIEKDDECIKELVADNANLLAACQEVKPLLYGFLKKSLGRRDKWPECRDGVATFQRLEATIDGAKGQSSA